ncbi:MAG: methylaspartate mutase, partial [Proteobacteria bacterium]|nr:methylaspartate mutase [Pseudomonadota bacterium]
SLGICVAPVGVGNEGETAIRVVVSYSDKAPVEIDVPFGVIEVLPLPLGERAALRLYPSREFDVGLGRGEAAAPRVEVQGGAVGIVIDCRGRPLQLPDDDAKRQAKLLQWFQAMRAYPPLTFVEGN